MRPALRRHRHAACPRCGTAALLLIGLGGLLSAQAAELPMPCVAGSCGTVPSFVTNGIGSAATAGNTLTITQSTENATFNWQRFNISSDGKVEFIQPSSSSIALNRIFQGSPSQIFGALNANGRVFLLNQNGFVFGGGATVNVGGLLASSLNLSANAVANGLLAPAQTGDAALVPFTDANGAALSSGKVEVRAGASLSTSDGGSILLFAPELSNSGRISTPGGQALLAAGSPVYLASSSDPNLRGLLVEVGTGGTVTNGVTANASLSDPSALVGQIIAERGNVTLAGLAVNQQGRVSATTAVTQNGSIRLQARDGGFALPGNETPVLATKGGTLTLGANSSSTIGLDASGDTAVDATAQPKSRIELDGAQVILQQGARVVARGGSIAVTARTDATTPASQFVRDTSNTARIFIAKDAVIDVSGAQVDRVASSNVVAAELRGTELADSPMQRDGALRGETVYIDSRLYGTRSDGTAWQGSPIGDLSGWVSTIKRDVNERSLAGGTVSMASQGDVILARGSLVNVAGGAIHYAAGYLDTTQLLGADGKTYDIGVADRDRVYTGIATPGSISVTNSRWGVTQTYAAAGQTGRYEAAYVQGMDAGSLLVSGSRVVLDGTLQATSQAGTYQRQLPQALSGTAMYRPYDQLPLGGQLVLGNAASTARNFGLGDIRFDATSKASVLQASFDPLHDTLPAGADVLRIGQEFLDGSGVSRITLRANGSVTLPSGYDLALRAAGALDIVAGAVTVDGTITVPSGSVTLAVGPTAPSFLQQAGLSIGNGAVVDVSGHVVNDAAAVNGGVPGREALAYKGGRITLTADREDLRIRSGASLLASGGAWLNASGKLAAGAGGAITLGVIPLPSGVSPAFQLDGTLDATALFAGGSLSLSAAAFCVAEAGTACLEDASQGLVRLQPVFFDRGGFGKFDIKSVRGGFELAPGTSVALSAHNYQVPENFPSVRTGSALRDVAATAQLDPALRGSVSLSAVVSATLPNGVLYRSDDFASAPNLVIGRGASIMGEAGATISLASNTRLLLDGTIQAPAGSINLVLNSSLPISPDDRGGYFTDQGIWLGDAARLLANGATRLTTDGLGRIVGDVLDGGTVSLTATRGHILTSAGSLIDVSGTQADVDIRADAVGSATRTRVGSAAGTISLTAAEAILPAGLLRGQSGDPGTVAGGSLRIVLSPVGRDDTAQNFEIPYVRFPDMSRSVELSAQSGHYIFGNSTLPSFYRGRALVGANQVAQGGFDALSLSAGSFTSNNSGVLTTHPGIVLFNGNVDLSLARSLSLNAPIIRSTGGIARLFASEVSLGGGDPLFQLVNPATNGTGTLSVTGNLVDVIGTSSLQGFSLVNLASTGDLRFRAVIPTQGNRYVGSLSTYGSLTLSAAQVYPTTLTEFTVTAGLDGQGILRIEQPARAVAGTVQSAGGSLTLSAPRVEQFGTLRAPFGSLTINASQVELGAGSTTSTSGTGLDVLFGSTQGGFDWVYGVGNGQSKVFGVGQTDLPSQHIALNGNDVLIRSGATLDASGGGRLLASEFIPGTSGTVDVLAGKTGAFAIVPQLKIADMPFDPQISSESTLATGRTVHLSGGAGLPAGDYLALPARYAVLPGAYLVQSLSGYRDLTAGEQFTRLDGSTVMSGYFGTAHTSLHDARTGGFAVYSADLLASKARYTLTSADDFFSAQAAAADVTASRLPRDAGTVALSAANSLQLAGRLQGQAASGGLGVALDIASDLITVGRAATPVTSGLFLKASDLNAFGAQSILLGGSRTTHSGGVAIDTVSSQVVIEDGASLSGREILLAATGAVDLRGSASITATPDATLSEAPLQLNGDGALLRVAGNGIVDVERSGSSGTAGSLLIGQGATLSALGGGINLEASLGATLAGRILATGGSLGVTGSRIVLGASGPVAGSGFAFTTGQLESLNLDRIALTSRGAIELHGAVGSPRTVLSGRNIALSAESLHALGGNVLIDAQQTLRLAGRAVDATPFATSSTDALTLKATDILFTGGSLRAQDFGSVNLVASGQARATADSQFSVDGSLTLTAQRLTTASGKDLGIIASGDLRYTRNGAGSGLPSVTDLGGKLSLTGTSLDIAGSLVMPSGIVDLSATQGSVHFTPTALIDVSGLATTFNDQVVGSAGGRVSVKSLSGDVQFEAGSRIDVSGGPSIAAGGVDIAAPTGSVILSGTIRAASTVSESGGDLAVEAYRLPSLGSLAAVASAGGLDGTLYFASRGSGDLTLNAGTAISARDITLVADGGGISIAGTLRSHGASGGRIRLASRDDLVLTGTLDASPESAADRNGRIALQASSGGLSVAAGTTVATTANAFSEGSASDGLVSLRLPRDIVTSSALSFAGDWRRTAGVDIEAFSVYQIANGVIGAATTAASLTNPIFADTQAFALTAPSIAAGLNTIGTPRLRVLAGVELQADSDLALNSAWNLSSWNASSLPGVLTLRSGGNLAINKSLSDGFTGTSGNSAFLLTRTTDSWSYRLVAGADLASADVLATNRDVTTGNLAIAAGNPSSTAGYVMVRTGTGSIDLRAAGDISLGNAASMVYTAGIARTGTGFSSQGELGGRSYPTLGGDISMQAGRDVTGAVSDQLVTSWLWRVGNLDSALRSRATAWTVAFGSFKQNVGTLGGGDVIVSAGRNVLDLSLSAPTVGYQSGGTRPASSVLQVLGGGNLVVTAGNDILGGEFYSGRGRVFLASGGSIGSSTQTAIEPLIALGDASVNLTARKDAAISAVVSPTLLPQGAAQSAVLTGLSLFSTYGANSAVHLTSISGEARVGGAVDPSIVLTSMDFTGSGGTVGLGIYPGTLDVQALRGDIEISRSFTMLPTPSGALSLQAYGNLGVAESSKIILSDASTAFIPGVSNPAGGWTDDLVDVLSNPYSVSPNMHATLPVRLAADLAGQSIQSRLVAQTGDILQQGASGSQSLFLLGGPVDVYAGRDIVDLNLVSQNLRPADISTFMAGRDLRFSIARSPFGIIVPNRSQIAIDGPGQVLLQAGRDINLENAAGIVTRGGLFNSALGSAGASLNLLAGVGGQAPDYYGFAKKYLRDGVAYDADMAQYVAAVTGIAPVADHASLYGAFSALDNTAREVFIQRALLAELKAAGRYAASADPVKNGDYSAGFAALNTLFPGSNPDTTKGETNRYAGNMALYFSRVYTLAGGDISMLAPGGYVNAGLSTPPSSFGVKKSASELGIVAQSTGSIGVLTYGDLLVNESRVFAADGGNILVWSTHGDIDAGRGAKTAVSAPPPTITIDSSGRLVVNFPAALTGSGIQTLATSAGREPGDVDLFAPRGVVNAGDAGIVAGNLTIGATAVLGADNIKVSGVSVGVPVDAGGLGASLQGVSSTASSAAGSAGSVAAEATRDNAPAAAAEAALNWLEVFVTGFGEEACKPEDMDCLKRQQKD